MKQSTAILTVSRPFMMTFDDQTASEAMDGLISPIGAITIDIHIMEESYSYIMFSNI